MEDTSEEPSTSTAGSSSSESQNFGSATYAMSRHRKNKVLVWQSRTLPGRVYEFVLATRFRIPGVFSWKCLHCAMLKEQMRKKGMAVTKKKIPLLLVDNDVIKEDPDRPFNAAHFCEGRDVVDATVLRTKLVFYDAFERADVNLDFATQSFAMNASEIAPFDLNLSEKQNVLERFDNQCVSGMQRVICKRRRNVSQAKAKRSNAAHEYYKYHIEMGPNISFSTELGEGNETTNDGNEESQSFLDESEAFPNNILTGEISSDSVDHDEYIDVEGDTDSMDPINS